MEFNGSKKATLYQGKNTKTLLSNKILGDQIHLLYEQNPFGITAQFFASIFLVITLWPVISHNSLIGWLIYMILISSLWFLIAIFYKRGRIFFNQKTWLIFFAIFTFLSGIGWGFAGSILIPTENLIYQTFVVMLMFGFTAGSLPFFSPIIFIYALFLFPAFIPFDIWLFSQGGIYVFLGFCGMVYMPIIFASCYYSNKFLVNFLSLHYKNRSLDTLNQLLERKVAQRTRELEKSLAITQSTLESTAEGLLVVSLGGHIEYCNQRFLDMWKIPIELASNPDFNVFIEAVLAQLKNPQEFLAKINKVNNQPRQESFDEIMTNNANVFEWHSKPHKLGNVIVGRVWSFHDITVRKQMEKQLAYQANHDLLTGLPNRTLLYDRINQGIAYAKRYQTQLNILFLDIDNFKLINDNLGHNSGDILLQKIARRLSSCTRDSDTVSRFGGDEFVILFIANKHNEVLQLSQKILSKVTQPMRLINHEIVVTASIGVSIYPKHGKDAATLLKNADMAMYLAKNLGRNNFQLYDETINRHAKKSLEMQIELRNALETNEFFLCYQPTIHLKTGEIIGVEALVRWRHPTKGIIHPLQFIPTAEESRIIIPLGEWIFRNACLQNKAWQEMGLRPVRMAINVSGVQLLRDNFVDMIESSLTEAQLDPRYIEIELTESTIMDDKKQNLYKLKQLKEIGIHLTIDDFGTGYSSLNYLKEFPVNKLKIDQSFTQDCLTDHNNASIIKAIIAMGHSLKLEVLAEGIETVEQLQFLQQCHCDEGQGFLYSHPMRAKGFAKLLARNKKYDIGQGK